MDQKKQKNQLNTWIRFSNMGLQMGIIIAGGVLLGVWLDKKYPNQYSAWTVICSLMGVFAALYNVFRQVKEMNKNE